MKIAFSLKIFFPKKFYKPIFKPENIKTFRIIYVSSIRESAGGPVLGTVFGNNEFGFANFWLIVY